LSIFQELQLSSRATGCISQPGGALHPYRLITGILARLLTVYSRHGFPSLVVLL
jgi:hypothetical protein